MHSQFLTCTTFVIFIKIFIFIFPSAQELLRSVLSNFQAHGLYGYPLVTDFQPNTILMISILWNTSTLILWTTMRLIFINVSVSGKKVNSLIAECKVWSMFHKTNVIMDQILEILTEFLSVYFITIGRGMLKFFSILADLLIFLYKFGNFYSWILKLCFF